MIDKPLWLKSNINMDGSLVNIFNNDGLEFFKATTDASNVVRIKTHRDTFNSILLIFVLITQVMTGHHYYY